MLSSARLAFPQASILFALGSKSLWHPKALSGGSSLAAVELCYRSVDCELVPQMGTTPVLFLTAVHVEQHLECKACHTRFFLVAKLATVNSTSLPIDKLKLRRTCRKMKQGLLNLAPSSVTRLETVLFALICFLRFVFNCRPTYVFSSNSLHQILLR